MCGIFNRGIWKYARGIDILHSEYCFLHVILLGNKISWKLFSSEMRLTGSYFPRKLDSRNYFQLWNYQSGKYNVIIRYQSTPGDRNLPIVVFLSHVLQRQQRQKHWQVQQQFIWPFRGGFFMNMKRWYWRISYQLCLLYVDDNLHESMQTVHVGDKKENILDCATLFILLQISKLSVLLERLWR